MNINNKIMKNKSLNSFLQFIIKYKKFFILFFGGTLFVILFLNMLVLYLLNPNSLKTEINRYLSQTFEKYNTNYNFREKQIRIEVEGNVYLSAFPKNMLKLNDIKIRNMYYDGKIVDINIRSMQMEIKLLPLFFKKIDTNTVFLDKANVMVRLNEKLLTEYKQVVTSKKLVKIEENEISGIGSKLKELLQVEDNSNIPEGYKEISFDEEKTFKIDNKDIERMMQNFFKRFKYSSFFSFNDVKKININDSSISIVDKENIVKGITNINADITRSGNNIISNVKLVSERERLEFNLDFRFKNSDLKISFDSKSNIYNNFNFDFDGKVNALKDLTTWSGKTNFGIQINSLSDLIKTFALNESQTYKRIINNDKIEIKSACQINNGVVNCEKNSIKSLNLNVDFKVYFNEFLKLILDVKNINFDSFFIKNVAEKNESVGKDKIIIFNVKNIDELTGKVKSIFDKKYNFDITADIKSLTFNSETFINNTIDFKYDSNGIKVRNIKINNKNGIELSIDNPVQTDGVFVHSLSLKGNKINSILSMLNIDTKYLNTETFDLKSKFIASSDRMIFYDSILNTKNSSTKLNLEYKPSNKDGFLAIDLKIDKLDLNNTIDEVKKVDNVKVKDKTTEKADDSEIIFIKEKILLLNNLFNNLYMNIEVNNLKYNKYEDMYLNMYAKIDKGFLKLEFNNSRLYNIENLSGMIIGDLNSSLKSQLFIDLNIDRINLNANIFPYLINLEKYRKIFKNEFEKIEESKNIVLKYNKFWITKLFEKSPLFNEIYGNFNLSIKNGKLNDIDFSNFQLKTKIEDGVFYIDNFGFDGFGGNTNITGSFALRKKKDLNLLFKKTIYNLEDIQKIVFNTINPLLKGKIGFGGYLKSNGETDVDFNNNMDMYFEFLTNSLYIRDLGIRDLKYYLSDIYRNKQLLETINPKEVLTKNNSGTMFKNSKGSFFLQNKIANLNMEGQGDELSGKMLLIVNNRDSNNILIDMLDTFAFYVDVNNKKIPLYTYISFKEDLQNKALLEINTDQIDSYLNQVRTTVKQAEMKEQKLKEELEAINKRLNSTSDEKKENVENNEEIKANNVNDQNLNNTNEQMENKNE